MTAPEARHATIVGAGIVGISTAAFLQMNGFQVTVIDRVEPGRGCSFGNAGGVVVSSVTPTVHPGVFARIPGWLLDPDGPLTIRWRHLPKALPWFAALGRNALPGRVAAITEARGRLAVRALGDHRTLLARAGREDLLVLEDGIHLYSSEEQYRRTEPLRAAKRRFGFDPRRLSRDEVRELEPDVTGDFACAVFWGGWYHVRNPYTVVKALAGQVMRDGGEIVRDEVVAIERGQTRVTGLKLASGKRLAVGNLVIAAGAWSHLLARQLGTRILLESERGYHLTMPDPGVKLSRAMTHEDQPGAVSPLDGGLRIAGTDEFAGLEAAPNWRRAEMLWTYGRRILPGLRPLDDNVSRWMGHRPGTPDSLPVIDRAPRFDNVWFGFGHGHMGLTWGPSTGRLIAEMMAGPAPNIDTSPFRADRFEHPRVTKPAAADKSPARATQG